MTTLLLCLSLHSAPLSVRVALSPLSLLAPGSGQMLRGDKALARDMWITSAALLSATLASGAAITFSGGSDIVAAVGVPVAMLGIGAYLGLGVADIAGAFSPDDGPRLHPGFERDDWNVRARLSAFVRAPFSELVPQLPEGAALAAALSYRAEGWLLAADAGMATLSTGDHWMRVGLGRRLIAYADDIPNAGLWVETSLRRNAQGRLSFDSIRWRSELVSVLPLGLLARRFSRVVLRLRLGLDPTWTTYRGAAQTDFELPLAGGFEVRVALFEMWRVFGGYDHSRDETYGGNALGFLGVFHAGTELSLPLGFVLQARVLMGTPSGFDGGVEWRW